MFFFKCRNAAGFLVGWFIQTEWFFYKSESWNWTLNEEWMESCHNWIESCHNWMGSCHNWMESVITEWKAVIIEWKAVITEWKAVIAEWKAVETSGHNTLTCTIDLTRGFKCRMSCKFNFCYTFVLYFTIHWSLI